MVDLPTLKSLLERVEKAEGPQYVLDLTIAQTLVPEIVVMRRNNDDTDNEPHTYRSFSAKVDDAIWLVNEMLPGAEYALSTIHGLAFAEMPINAAMTETICSANREDGNMPLAIIEALLRALIQKETDDHA